MRKDPPSPDIQHWQDVRARAIDQDLDGQRRVVGERVAALARWGFIALLAIDVNVRGLSTRTVDADLVLVGWLATAALLSVPVARRQRPGRWFSILCLGLDLLFGALLMMVADGYASIMFLAYFLIVVTLAIRIGIVISLAAAVLAGGLFVLDPQRSIEVVGDRLFLFSALGLSGGLMARELERERRMAISHAAQADQLLEMSVGMSGGTDIKDVFGVVLAQALRMTAAETGGLMVAYDHRVELAAGEGYDEQAVLRVAARGEHAFLDNHAALLVPIASGEGMTAVLALAGGPAGLGREDLLTVNALVGASAVPLANALHYQRRAEEAISDSLTGLVNRREFRRRLEGEFGRSRHRHSRLALLLVDLDHFKSVNDSLGHQAGDEVIRAAAHVLRACGRTVDTAARYGGDELALVLVDAGPEGASLVAERLVDAVTSAAIPIGGGQHLTVSVGVSCFPQDAITADELVTMADEALYLVKREGRNGYRTAAQLVQRLTTDAYSLVQAVSQSGPQVIAAAGHAIDARVPGRGLHSSRVAAIATLIADASGYPAAQREALLCAAYLHDLGGVLAGGHVREHAELGSEAIASGPFPPGVVEAVRHHHERWDGAGFPRHLVGAEIPLEARIVAVADDLERLVAGRDGQEPLASGPALDRLGSDPGAHDPDLLDALRLAAQSGELGAVFAVAASGPETAAQAPVI